MKTANKTKTLLWVSGALTAVICLVMNLVLIPMIEAGTNGIRCFDMQSTGYTYETAKEFLALIGNNGRSVYLHWQLPLDFFYPVAYTAFFMLALKKLSGKAWPLIVPGALAAFDYAENVCSIIMLKNMSVTESMAKLASTFTVIKSGLMTITFILLAVFLIIWIIKKRKQKQ